MIELIKRALFDGESDQALVLTPAPASEDEPESGFTEEELAFVDELLPEGGKRRTLPPISADYPDEVQALIREEGANRIYVLPPYRPFYRIPKDIQRALRERFGRADLAVITLDSVLEVLDEEGKVAFTLPVSFFTGRRTERYRAKSLKLGHPEMIIQSRTHPFGRGVHSQVSVQTIIYSGKMIEDETPVTKFFSIPDPKEVDLDPQETEWNAVVEDFERVLQQRGGETEHGFVVRERLAPSETWSYESYDPDLRREIDDVEKMGEIRPLEALFEVHDPSSLQLEDHDPSPLHLVALHVRGEASHEEEQAGEVPVLEARDIRSDGSLAYDDTRRRIKKEELGQEGLFELKAGDLCIRRIISARQDLIAGEVEDHMTPMVCSERVIVLRPRENTAREDRQVVLQYLQSETASRYLRAKQGSIMGDLLLVDIGELRKMSVPMADDDLRNALRSLTEAADLFGNWKEEALDAARSLFDFPTTKDGKMHVLTTGRRTRQRQHAAERQEDLSYRIQTQFPHPVAYRWRTVAASKPDLEGYLHVLECAEVALCYLVLMAITSARAAGEDIGYLKQMGQRIARGRGGTNFGDWVAILREVRGSKAFRRLPDSTPFYEVMRFMPEGSAVDQAVSSLKEKRDDQAHGRGPRGNAVIEAFKEAKRDLLELLAAAEFVSEYPLRYIDRTKADTLADNVTYWYRDVMGDHPLVPVERKTVEPCTLEAESLYLVDRSGELHLLRPLLDRRRCPECGTWSTFYLDSCEGEGGPCHLKSMEHSHTAKDPDVYDAFQKVGLLP